MPKAVMVEAGSSDFDACISCKPGTWSGKARCFELGFMGKRVKDRGREDGVARPSFFGCCRGKRGGGCD